MKQLSPHTETQAEGLMFILMKSLRLFSRYTFHKNQPGRQLQFLPLAGMFCLFLISQFSSVEVRRVLYAGEVS